MSSLFSSRNVIFDESHLARASVETDKEKQEETERITALFRIIRMLKTGISTLVKPVVDSS